MKRLFQYIGTLSAVVLLVICLCSPVVAQDSGSPIYLSVTPLTQQIEAGSTATLTVYSRDLDYLHGIDYPDQLAIDVEDEESSTGEPSAYEWTISTPQTNEAGWYTFTCTKVFYSPGTFNCVVTSDDTPGWNNDTAVTRTVTVEVVDTTPPTFTNVVAHPTPAKLDTLVTITFTSEDLPTNPTVQVNGHSATYVSKSASNNVANYTYTYCIQTSDPDGDATISFYGIDRVGNAGTGSNTTALDVDKTAPSCTVTGPTSPTRTSPIEFALTFSESVTDLTIAEINVTNGTKGTLSGSGTTYSLLVTPSAQGPVTCQVIAGAALDAAGNGNTQSNNLSVVYDSANPTVTVNQATGQGDPVNTSTINFTAVFSEPVTGFAADDVTISGVTGCTVAVTGSGPTYNLAVSGMTSSGTMTASIAAGRAQDEAGNTNNASTSTDNSVVFDNAAPSIPDAPTDDGEYTSSTSVTFDWLASTDNLSGVASYECRIGTTVGGSNTFSGNVGTALTKTITGTHNTTYYCQVRSLDHAGNTSNWSTSSNGIKVDTTAPSVVATVTDDGSWTPSSTQLHASWTAATDAESGIAEYEYAIGTTSGGTQVLGWTSNGASTDVVRSGLTLTNGTQYYISVRAKNRAGITGSAQSSNGIYVVLPPQWGTSAVDPSGTVKLAWTWAPGPLGFQGADVYYSADGTNWFPHNLCYPAAGPSNYDYRIWSMPLGTTRHFKVVTYGTAGEPHESSVYTRTISADVSSLPYWYQDYLTPAQRGGTYEPRY